MKKTFFLSKNDIRGNNVNAEPSKNISLEVVGRS